MLQNEKSLKRWRCALWGLVLALMLLIYLFSAQTGEESGDTSSKVTRFIVQLVHADYEELSPEEQNALIERWHMWIRKGAHFTEYAVLAAAICCLMHTYPLRGRTALAWLAATAYAAMDEAHQLFVAERMGSVKDVLIDSSGALFGAAAAFCLLWLIVRKRRGHTEGRK